MSRPTRAFGKTGWKQWDVKRYTNQIRTFYMINLYNLLRYTWYKFYFLDIFKLIFQLCVCVRAGVGTMHVCMFSFAPPCPSDKLLFSGNITAVEQYADVYIGKAVRVCMYLFLVCVCTELVNSSTWWSVYSYSVHVLYLG